MIGNQNRHIYIGGYDVTRYALNTKIPASLQNKPEWGELPAITNLEFDLRNDKGYFSAIGLLSIFNGLDLTLVPLKVTQEQGTSVLIEWEGYIQNVLDNDASKIVSVTGISRFSKLLDSPALISLGSDTPSELSRLVFGLFSIPVNATSYSKANFLLSGLVAARLDPNLLESQITLMELQKQLAIAGYARIYSVNGQMVYEVYNSTTITSSTIEIDERDLMESPVIVKETRENHFYTVETLGIGTATSAGWTSGSNSNNLDFGPNAVVKVTSLSAGQQIANQWEAIDRIQSIRVDFAVLHKIGNMLDLNSYILFTFAKKGIDAELMEIVGIDRSDNRYTKLIGRIAL